MISLVTKKSKINLANTNTGIEIEQQGTGDITLAPEESNIELAASNDSIELKENYIKGDKGEDGFSPTIDVIEVDEGHKFVITDVEGTEEVIVRDGKDGKDGEGGGAALVEGDNTVIEDNAINVYTNTGYAVSDKDIKIQPILDNNTYGENHIVYTDNEVMIIYNGTLKIKRSTNGIDFEDIRLPYSCKSMVYNPNSKIIFGLCNGYFIFSEDDGLTWNSVSSTFANGTYLAVYSNYSSGFLVINMSTRRITAITYNETNKTFSQNGYLTSSIIPQFTTKFSTSQYIWCNNSGVVKYGAGSQEGNFASISLGSSSSSVSLLKNVNDYPYIGLTGGNKLYRLKNSSGVTGNEWIEYTLPDTCAVYDITFNPYDETYYIFTNINTYYKTKDFELFESVDKDGLRGREAEFTLMGIQATIANQATQLLLAPTRTKLENKAQEWDRALDKTRWAGNGLGVDGEKIYIKASAPLRVNENYLFLAQLEEHNLPDSVLEAIYVATAPIEIEFDPYNMDSWFWEYGYPMDGAYCAYKLMFNQEGSFWDQMNWETEYVVEQYEYGYIFTDTATNYFKYVKLGNLAPLFN